MVTGAERAIREFRRGSLRLAILHGLQSKESYGYEILQRLREAGSLHATEAAVYPLLHDLEKEGAIRGAWRPNAEGVPPRKYYSLTKNGETMLHDMTDAWRKFRDDLDRFLEGRR